MPTIASSPASPDTLFGRVRLGYLLIESVRLDAWSTFVTEGLGLHADRPQPTLLACRIDAHQRRLIVRRTSGRRHRDRLAAGRRRGVGLRSSGCPRSVSRCCRAVRTKPRCEGDALLALHRTEAVAHRVVHRRGADRFAVADEGKRIRDRRIGPRARRDHDASAGSDAGVLEKGIRRAPVRRNRGQDRRPESRFRISAAERAPPFARDRGDARIRLNPLRTQIHHLNLQCASLDDVTQAYLRCRSMGYPIANAIGQHRTTASFRSMCRRRPVSRWNSAGTRSSWTSARGARRPTAGSACGAIARRT